jgi:MFS family permease
MLPARAASQFGDDMAVLVLLLRVYGQGRGPWAITGLLLCSAVPVVVLAPLAGRLVDSVPFRQLAVASAAWSAACCVGLAAVGSLWSIYLLVVLLQMGQVVALPAWQALVPEIVEADEVGGAVGAGQALSTAAAVGAPAVAGVLVGELGFGAPLLVDAGTFLVLVAAALAIRATRHSRTDTAPSDAPADAYRLSRDPLLWPLILGICALVLVGEVSNVVEVFLVRGTLGAGSTAFGLIAAALAAGIAVGALLAGRRVSEPVRALRTALAALILGVTLALAGLAPALWIFAVAWTLLGVSNGFVNVDASTLLLSRTPERRRGRVLATVNGMVRSSSLVALLIGGLAGTLLGPRETFVAGGSAMALVALGLALRLRPQLTRTPSADSERTAAAPSSPPSEAAHSAAAPVAEARPEASASS